jgi:hypothetical protein
MKLKKLRVLIAVAALVMAGAAFASPTPEGCSNDPWWAIGYWQCVFA